MENKYQYEIFCANDECKKVLGYAKTIKGWSDGAYCYNCFSAEIKKEKNIKKYSSELIDYEMDLLKIASYGDRE